MFTTRKKRSIIDLFITGIIIGILLIFQHQFTNSINSIVGIYLYIDNNINNYFHINLDFQTFLFIIIFGGIIIRNTVRSIIKFILRKNAKKRVQIAGSRETKNPITIQYNPPNNIDPAYAFFLWYNNRTEPKIFTALLYYRASHNWIKIEQYNGGYAISEIKLKPEGSSEIDDDLIQKFFGVYDNTLDKVRLEKSYRRMNDILWQLKGKFISQGLIKYKSGFRGGFGIQELTEKGKEIFDHMRGYKEYLSKVERLTIESELKRDPDYINKILPWAILFGIETKIVNITESFGYSLSYHENLLNINNNMNIYHILYKFQNSL